jgi:hypothetical protein
VVSWYAHSVASKVASRLQKSDVFDLFWQSFVHKEDEMKGEVVKHRGDREDIPRGPGAPRASDL